MKIYINGRFLTQRMTGVNRYAYEMTRALIENASQSVIVICPPKINSEYNVDKFNIRYFGIGKSHFWEQIILPLFFILKKEYLLLNFSGLGSLIIKNQFMTIHDLSFWQHPEWFSKPYFYFYRALTPIMAKRCMHIITVSNFSKCQIIDCLKITPAKISVIHNAVSDKFLKTKDKIKPKFDFDYILGVASIDPRKNFAKLLEAYRLIDKKIKLVIVGKNNNKIFRNSNSLENNNNIIHLQHITDDELIDLYQNAKVLVYLSLYEGFGLPVIEAIATGCPAIVSDIEVFREIYGKSVQYCNPIDILDIKNSINKVLYDNDYKKNIETWRLEVLSKYTWKNSAQKLELTIKSFK